MHPDFNVASWAANQPFKDKRFVNQMLLDLEKLGVKARQ